MLLSPDFEGWDENWISYDMSWGAGGPQPTESYWGRDTVRMHPLDDAYNYLDDGDDDPHSWWCGTTNDCWQQSRGYGNDWACFLQRSFTAGDLATSGGLYLEFDQRFAMDARGDYGYFGVSYDGGNTWDEDFGWGPGASAPTKFVAHNTMFQGGMPHDWLSPTYGHVELDLSDYVGLNLVIRFRFESDGANSCVDDPVNDNKSVEDGAWQLDNFTFYDGPSSDPERTVLWSDDCEGDDYGWVHSGATPTWTAEQQFAWGHLGLLGFETGAGYSCGAPDELSGVWWSAAPGPQMANWAWTWLVSPPIDISGVPEDASLVAQWNMWIDFPANSHTSYSLSLASCNSPDVNKDLSLFIDEQPGWWYGGPWWGTWGDNWDAFAGNDWLAIMWQVGSSQPPEPGVDNGTGMFLNSMKVGYVPSGGVTFERDSWNKFHDWWREDSLEALDDFERIQITSDFDIVLVDIWARLSDWDDWDVYGCQRESPGSDWWVADGDALSSLIFDAWLAGGEIHYYYEAYSSGPSATYPDGAPGTDEPGEARYFQFSLLPIDNPETGEPPDVLLVDKHGRRTPGEGRDYAHYSEYYYREALEIEGYVDELGNPLYDVYDVEVPSAANDQSDGPPFGLLDQYNTVVWFSSDTPTASLKSGDAQNLMAWLDWATETNPRSLWLTGNSINTELAWGDEYQTQFQSDYLLTELWGNSVVSDFPPDGDGHLNLQPRLINIYGGEVEFMTYDDGECILAGDCPLLPEFDVVAAAAGTDAEFLVDYEIHNGTIWFPRPAGVSVHVETDPPYGADWYSVVNLGFGLEFMMDSIVEGGGRTDYTYVSGINDRVSVVENIVEEFFEVPPDTLGSTGVVVDERRNELSQAYPNPFNPVTKIAYSVKDAGRVTIRIYNVVGREVRTLLDTEMDAGASGHVVWDGFDDASERCGTGVYFYHIEAPGFATSKKMIMLK